MIARSPLARTKKRTVSPAGFALLLVAGYAVGGEALAHIVGLPIATLSNPRGTEERADQSYLIKWMDSDRPVATGTSTLEIWYTAQNPPTYPQGVIPDTLTGTVVVAGIFEKDTTNEYTWDTSAVPTGTYWLWSHVVDPPAELNTIPIATLSPGVLTIVHGDDPVPPAIIVTKPDSPYRWADDFFEIEYRTSDPDGAGRVRIEATKAKDGSGLVLVADELPANATGTYVWDTTDLEETDWSVRATITDARGQSFSAWARYFVLVTHAVRPTLDAGVRRDAGQDASVADSGLIDAGVSPKAEEPASCECVAKSAGGGARAAWIFGLGLLCVWRRPRPR